MELVLCIGSDRHRKIKTHPTVDVAHLLRGRGHFPEKQSDEREKLFRQASQNSRLWRKRYAYPDREGKGIEPSPSARARFSTTTTRSDMVRVLRQLAHVRKERWRLTDEETHVR
jgi:hypothetical protein